MAFASEERQSLFVLAYPGATCMGFHCQLTLFFISGGPTYALKLRYVSKWMESLSARYLPTEMWISSARKSTLACQVSARLSESTMMAERDAHLASKNARSAVVPLQGIPSSKSDEVDVQVTA